MAKPSDNRKAPSNSQPARPRIKRAVRFVLILCVAVLLMPTLLTVSGQHQPVLRLVAPHIAEAVSFESVSTHWWEPLDIHRLRVSDLTFINEETADDLPLATATRVSTRQALWEILLTGGNGIELVAEQPVLNIAVYNDTTNLEATVSRILETSDGQASSANVAPLQITVIDGTVRLIPDEITAALSRWTTIKNISGTFSTLNSESAVPDVFLVADLTGAKPEGDGPSTVAGGMNPRIAATLDELAGDMPLLPFDESELKDVRKDESRHSLSINISPANSENGNRIATVELWHVDLAEVSPLVSRFFPGISARGRVHGRLQAQLQQGNLASGCAARVQLLGEDVYFRHKSWAANEFAELDRLTLRSAGAVAEDGMLLNQLEVTSKLFNLRGQGEVRHREQAEGEPPADNEVRVAGSVDLATLSKMIPQTLQLHEEVSIDALDVKFSGRLYEDKRDFEKDQLFGNKTAFRWQSVIETSPVEAIRDGRRVTIPNPIRLDAIGIFASQTPDLVRARVTGDFGSLSVDPMNDGYNVSARITPDSLWQNMKQIVELPPLSVHGPVEVSTTIRRQAGGTELTSLRMQSRDISVESDYLRILDEGNLFHRIAGQIKLHGNAPAVKTLISPWHDAFWLSDDSRVAAGVSGKPGHHLQLSAVVEPINQQSKIPKGGFVDRGTVDARITIDERRQEFGIDKGVITLPGTTAEFNGNMSARDGVIVTNVTADVSYDLDSLSRLAGDDIRLTGQGAETIHITGAPALLTQADATRFLAKPGVARDASERVAPLMISGGFKWTGGEVYGTPIGAGGTSFQLRDGLLRAEPVSFSVGTGQAFVIPRWDIVSNRVQLAPGSYVEQIDITPQLASEWLSYVSPLLSDATSVSGNLSCRLQNFDWFIDQPQQSQVQAKLSIHEASASPGASLRPLLQVAETLSRKQLTTRQLTFPQQEIPIELRDGMVIHNGLQFSVAGYDVSSFGAVGTTGQIQVTLDVPLERTSVGQTPRTVRIPVQGTVGQPRIDASQLLQNVGRQQLQDKVQGELNRGLDRLLNKLGR